MGRAMSPDFDRTGCVSPIRDISGAFDGRATIPNAFRLATPLRSRRERTGAIPAYPPGKEAALGTSLRDRLATKAMYVSPPRVPNFVNASDRGSIEFAVMAVEAPLTAPKRSEFARFACASSKGGVRCVFALGVSLMGVCVCFNIHVSVRAVARLLCPAHHVNTNSPPTTFSPNYPLACSCFLIPSNFLVEAVSRARALSINTGIALL